MRHLGRAGMYFRGEKLPAALRKWAEGRTMFTRAGTREVDETDAAYLWWREADGRALREEVRALPRPRLAPRDCDLSRA